MERHSAALAAATRAFCSDSPAGDAQFEYRFRWHARDAAARMPAVPTFCVTNNGPSLDSAAALSRASLDGQRLSRETLDRLQIRPLAVIAKGNGNPAAPGPARTADAMDVVVRIDRQIEVHDVRDVVDVQPAGGNVGGHQDQRLRRLEAEQHALPRRLTLVAVKGVGLNAGLHQRLGHLVGAVLGPREYQRPRPRRLPQPMGQQLQLLLLVDEEHRLPNRLDRDRGGRDAHVHGIGQPLVGQRANGRGQRGGEQQRLPPLGTFGHDPPQIVDKAHVEHPIGLVEDQHFDVRQVHEALLHQVQQPPGRGDQDVDAVVQGPHLRRLAHAAVNRGLPHGGIAAVSLETLADLQCQFAGRGEHQRADLPSPPIDAALVAAEPLQGGQGEGGRLAGSRLRTAQHVAPFENRRNGGGLNLGGGGVALRANGAQERLGKAEFFKLHQRFLQ